MSSKKTDVSNDNIKNKEYIKNSLTFSKEQTKSREMDKRYDAFGNLITHGGKQKVTFIDKTSKNNFTEVIKVESFKEYNKMEEVAPKDHNGCCLLIWVIFYVLYNKLWYLIICSLNYFFIYIRFSLSIIIYKDKDFLS